MEVGEARWFGGYADVCTVALLGGAGVQVGVCPVDSLEEVLLAKAKEEGEGEGGEEEGGGEGEEAKRGARGGGGTAAHISSSAT